MLKLPKHIALTITHNDHATYYETVEDALKETENLAEEWAGEGEREHAIATGHLWTCQWYPRTPVGFRLLRAATLETLLARLAAISEEETC